MFELAKYLIACLTPIYDLILKSVSRVMLPKQNKRGGREEDIKTSEILLKAWSPWDFKLIVETNQS